MSIREIESTLDLNHGSQTLKNQYYTYCDWCWGHGYGRCDICKRVFHKYYIPMRIAEKQKELGLEVTRGEDANGTTM